MMPTAALNRAVAPSVEAPSRNSFEVAELAPRPDALPAHELIDRSIRAAVAQWTGGLSLAALAFAFAVWQVHLAASPAKRLSLTQDAIGEALRLAEAFVTPRRADHPWSMLQPSANDRRFSDSD